MNNPQQLHFGQGEKPAVILGHFANRHGLITGATGTGKTVTLQVLAENFAELGVPVFITDIKGDVSGLSQAGKQKEFLDMKVVSSLVLFFWFPFNPLHSWFLTSANLSPLFNLLLVFFRRSIGLLVVASSLL